MSALTRPSRVYWVTRDTDTEGVLSDHVDVWDVKPTMHRYYGEERGLFWLDDNGGINGRYGRFPLEAVAHWGHTLPDTERECIRVEVGISETPPKR
jgi:hypothetical protein